MNKSSTELAHRTPIDFGKANLQEHLLAFASTRNLQQVDDLAFRGRGGGDFPGAQHHAGARDGPRQHRGILVGADLDVFAREQCLQLLLQRRDRLFDDDVVLGATGVTPDDQADRARRFPVDQDLARRNDRRLRHRRIGHRDAGDVELGRQDGRAARCHDDARHRRLRCVAGGCGAARPGGLSWRLALREPGLSELTVSSAIVAASTQRLRSSG